MVQCECGSYAINEYPKKKLCDCCWRDMRLKLVTRSFKQYTDEVKQYIDCVDAEFKKPVSNVRGRRLAGLLNMLEMATDTVRHFTLGLDLKTGKKVRVKL